MIDFEKFTNYSQEIIFAANAKKDFYKNSEVQPEHIIMAMIEDKGIAKDYLQELKLLNQHFINAIVAKIKEYPTISGVSASQQVFLSRDTNALLEIATKEAESLKDDFIGIECILIAMTKLENSFIKDLQDTENAISEAIGTSYTSHLFRFPNGSKGTSYSSQKKQCIKYLEEINYGYVDWNALNQDSIGHYNSNELLNNLKKTTKGKNSLVILMHDTADVSRSYLALEDSIKFLKSEGYTFKTFEDFVTIRDSP